MISPLTDCYESYSTIKRLNILSDCTKEKNEHFSRMFRSYCLVVLSESVMGTFKLVFPVTKKCSTFRKWYHFLKVEHFFVTTGNNSLNVPMYSMWNTCLRNTVNFSGILEYKIRQHEVRSLEPVECLPGFRSFFHSYSNDYKIQSICTS